MTKLILNIDTINTKMIKLVYVRLCASYLLKICKETKKLTELVKKPKKRKKNTNNFQKKTS